MTHEEAVEQVIEQASESYECLEGQVDAAERVQPPPHLTPEEVQEIRDWIATPPTSHVDDLIYRALRELSEIRQYEPPPQDRVDWRAMALRVKHKSAGPECS